MEQSLFSSYIPTSEGETIALIRSEFPDVKIYKTKSWWLKALAKVPFLKQLDSATQAIGKSIYLSSLWDQFSTVQRISTLLHEREHLRQFRKYGIFLMGLLYIFIFFPVGLSYFRWKFEREAMRWSVRTKLTLYGHSALLKETLEDYYLKMACSSFYVYPFPFRRYIQKSFRKDYMEISAEVL